MIPAAKPVHEVKNKIEWRGVKNGHEYDILIKRTSDGFFSKIERHRLHYVGRVCWFRSPFDRMVRRVLVHRLLCVANGGAPTIAMFVLV
jgi:hypothetical protein